MARTLALLVAAALGSLALAVEAQSRSKPRLELESEPELVITGSGFKSGETVRLDGLAVGAEPFVVRASKAGSFVILVPARIMWRVCARLPRLKAWGSKGTQAKLQVGPRRGACPELQWFR